MSSIHPFTFGAFVVETAFLGEVAAFALGDGTVRLATGPDVVTANVHGGAILASAADGSTRLLTGGDDGLFAAIDAKGAVARLAERPRKWIDAVAAGPSGAVAFASGKQATVLLADGGSRAFDAERTIGGIAFAPKGMRLAIAGYGGATLWWAATDAAPVRLAWPGAHVAAAFSPDGKYLMTAMQENALHGWRLADGQDLRMSGYPAKTRSMSWSAKGRFLATSGAHAAVLWPFHFKDGPLGKQPLELGMREVLVSRVACHPRQELLAIGYQDGMVLLVRFADAQEALARRAGDGPVSALAWDGSGRRLAFGTEEGAAGVLEIG